MGLLSAPAAVDKREYWGFSFFDWANSGYVTTVSTVLFAPYLTSVAETAACGRVGTTPAGPTSRSSASGSPRARWLSTSSRWRR